MEQQRDRAPDLKTAREAVRREVPARHVRAQVRSDLRWPCRFLRSSRRRPHAQRAAGLPLPARDRNFHARFADAVSGFVRLLREGIVAPQQAQYGIHLAVGPPAFALGPYGFPGERAGGASSRAACSFQRRPRNPRNRPLLRLVAHLQHLFPDTWIYSSVSSKTTGGGSPAKARAAEQFAAAPCTAPATAADAAAASTAPSADGRGLEKGLEAPR